MSLDGIVSGLMLDQVWCVRGSPVDEAGPVPQFPHEAGHSAGQRWRHTRVQRNSCGSKLRPGRGRS